MDAIGKTRKPDTPPSVIAAKNSASNDAYLT